MNHTIISARNVSKIYQKGEEKVHALVDISLDILRGQYVSIIGPSGSGKSTFFNMVGGLDTPSSGEILIEGHRLSRLNSAQLAWFRCHKIGFIFQSFNLVPTMTALENVAIARMFASIPADAARRDAASVLERVGLGHRLHHLPRQLSGGQQQRVAIARALVNQPLIILADEPTGNLDLKTGEEIINLLSEMKRDRGITVVTATHDMKMLSRSDFVVRIDNGAIAGKTAQADLKITVGSIDGKTVM